MQMILGSLEGSRLSVVEAAFAKISSGRSSVAYARVRDAYDSSKHPEVCNGR
jgi:hypothetical protein